MKTKTKTKKKLSHHIDGICSTCRKTIPKKPNAKKWGAEYGYFCSPCRIARSEAEEARRTARTARKESK